MKLPFICGNWKMYKTVADAVKYVKEFRGLVKDVSDIEIVLAPTFTALHAAAEAARNSNVVIAAQDLYWEREGAFTGEISAPMIREAGAEYVIVGHSERRTLFGDTDTTVNRKTVAAFAAGRRPVPSMLRHGRSLRTPASALTSITDWATALGCRFTRPRPYELVRRTSSGPGWY